MSAFIGNLVAVYPQAKDLINVDQIITEMSMLLDNPQSILHSPEELAKIRKVAAQQQAQIAKMQMQQHIATTMNTGAQAAQTLADTNVGSGRSALDAMLGGGGGQR